MSGPLRLAADGAGWLRDGRPWTASRPFLAVIGRPVDRSLSPVFQGAALDAAGFEIDYHAVDAGPGELATLRDRGAALGLLGFNVTMPCKAAAAALCADLSEAARRVGVVNTVRCDGGRWIGHNTDLGGVLAVIRARTADAPAQGVVLGAGGSARAAAAALLDAGARSLRVVARPGERADALRTLLDGWDADAACVDWGTPLGELLTTPDDVLVSCVPPAADEAELLHGPAPVRPALWLDLRYGLDRPAALDALDPPWADGRDVLLEQGALAFEWWLDRPAPRDVMRTSLART